MYKFNVILCSVKSKFVYNNISDFGDIGNSSLIVTVMPVSKPPGSWYANPDFYPITTVVLSNETWKIIRSKVEQHTS